MEQDLENYRTLLVDAEQKAQDDFDKTVLTLSGGALGISFAFVKDFIGDDPIVNAHYLLASWVMWGVSMVSILSSFYFSQQALRKAIIQVDKGEIHSQTPGGLYSRLTAILNIVGAILFFIGVILIIIFAGYNLK